MADTKRGREKQAANRERRQRERELTEELQRWEEEEPQPADLDIALEGLVDEIETHEYPVSTSELVAEYGDHEVFTLDGWEPLEELLAESEDKTHHEPADVRKQVIKALGRT